MVILVISSIFVTGLRRLIYMKSMETRIIAKLVEQFTPTVLDVINESYMHSVPDNAETHFKVTIVSESFLGAPQVRRHQAIYSVLSGELQGGVHALALHTFSPEEWQLSGEVPKSPNCAGKEK